MSGFKGGKIPQSIIKTYEFVMQERCIRCGKRLKSIKSRRLGFGPQCYQKYIAEKGSKYKNRRLF